MYYKKRENLLFFERSELENLINRSYENLMLEIINRHDLKPQDDIKKLWKIVSSEQGLKKLFRDRDEHEVFAATYSISDFYGENSKICFEMKEGFNSSKNLPLTLDDLNRHRKINSIVDFGILSDSELRQFQLKRYRGDLSSRHLLQFIEKILKHYGNDMGDVNLLIILQSPGTKINDNIFKELHGELIKRDFSFGGHILISFNANNKFDIIKTVFPELGTSSRSINWNYPDLITG